MHGNISEWCQDWIEPYKPEAAVDTQGPPKGQRHVLRGGSWGNFAGYCRSAYRLGADPVDRRNRIGFRVADSLAGPLSTISPV